MSGSRFASASSFGACLLALALCFGCSLGEGEGAVRSERLQVQDCWDGPFDLNPDFFAALPYRQTLTIRIQHGGDLEELSDGLLVLIDDLEKVANQLGVELPVGLPPGVRPLGVPLLRYDPNPPLVHMTLYLHRACHAQNSSLYAVDGTIVFRSLFNGDTHETDASKRLTEATFDVNVSQLRELEEDGTAAKKSRLVGQFKFYFQRGQPAQPFP